MSDIEQPRKALVARILDGQGQLPHVQRRAAFDDDDRLTEPAKTLVHKVTERAYTVDDADVAAIRRAGMSDDQIFELVVCAAVGEASRQYDAALAALDEATTD
jgi:alkylhydroperoxidase family enzyme